MAMTTCLFGNISRDLETALNKQENRRRNRELELEPGFETLFNSPPGL
jgi:hypothetical protein